KLLVSFVERIVPAVIPAEEHQHARWQRQHPGVENALHAQSHVGPERLAERPQDGEQTLSNAGFRKAPDSFAKILNKKPVRGMNVLTRARIAGDEFHEAFRFRG